MQSDAYRIGYFSALFNLTWVDVISSAQFKDRMRTADWQEFQRGRLAALTGDDRERKLLYMDSVVNLDRMFCDFMDQVAVDVTPPKDS